jgi:hypothetical protein
MKPYKLLQGFGVAALVLYPVYAQTLADQASARMHSPERLTSFALAIIANIVLVALVATLLWLSLRRTFLSIWVKACLPALYVSVAAEWICLRRTQSMSTKVLFVSFASTLCLIAILYRLWPQLRAHIDKGCGIVCAGLGLFAILVIGQLAVLACWRPSPNFIDTKSPDLARAAPDRPRVVWVLMDELSYSQVFEQRAAGLNLSNFDALARTSTVFSQVTPATNSTQTAVPSIMLGRLVETDKYTWGNRYLVARPGESLHAFPAADTPFALAKSKGWSTGVVGWFNPYCSMLDPYLDQCYWTFQSHFPAGFIVGDSFWRDIEDTWARYWLAINPKQNERAIEYLVDVYKNLTARSESVLAQDQPDFVFIHLPVPHPPGFYDRRTGLFDSSGRASYVDNLALADKTLGQILAILRASPRWPNTSVLVCGDHSWRVTIWRNARHWTHEDEIASHGGVFDTRPLLMVHRAGQTSPAVVDTSISLMQVHDILDHLILGDTPDSRPSEH